MAFFNPRLREGGDEIEQQIKQIDKFSIHASAKEATVSEEEKKEDKNIFNPRLREGGDQKIKRFLMLSSFQSTPPRRRRRILLLCSPLLPKFSIHASAKEATKQRFQRGLAKRIFNPRLREGGDEYQYMSEVAGKIFNPRLREGGDRNIL